MLNPSMMGAPLAQGTWQLFAADSVPSRGSNVNLNTVAPDQPLTSGWTAWDYGATASNYLAMTYAAIKSNVANPPIIYPNVNFNHNNIRLYVNIARLSADRTGSGYYIALMSSSSDSIQARLSLGRGSAGATTIQLETVNSAGTVTNVGSLASVNLGVNGVYTFILEIRGNTLSAYYASGSNIPIESCTLLASAPLPADILALSRLRRFSLRALGSTTLISEHYISGNVRIWRKF